MNIKVLKTELFAACQNYLNGRKETATLALQQAVEASNDDTKSSAGDKYETTREMMQQEIDRNKKMLMETGMMEQMLAQAVAVSKTTKVQNGSLVSTNNGSFLIAIGAGKLEVHGKEYFAISQASPLGQKMLQLKENDRFEFNGRSYQILAVH